MRQSTAPMWGGESVEGPQLRPDGDRFKQAASEAIEANGGKPVKGDEVLKRMLNNG